MATSINLHPRGEKFSTRVDVHPECSAPFSVLIVKFNGAEVNLFAGETDAITLTRIAKLLNEVFAKEGEQVE